VKKKRKNNLFSKNFERFEGNGVLCVDKPTGMTSNDVLNRLKRILPRTKMGHGGTLDPFATGVLPVFLNRATRLARYFLHADKVYEGTVRFGWATDTYDRDGQPDGPSQTPNFTPVMLLEWVTRFQGDIRQTPPIYSSLKWKGKPLYSYARRGVDAPLPERTVTIHQFDILEWREPFMDFHIHCSSGTYIRSIGHDLGLLAGCGAHLTELRRIRSGPFSLADAVTLDSLENNPSLVTTAVVPMEDLFPEMALVACNDETARRVMNGNDVIVPVQPILGEGDLVKLSGADGGLLALGEVVGLTETGARIHPAVVLRQSGHDSGGSD
jgi:tRNA pseudouridine55 synthase